MALTTSPTIQYHCNLLAVTSRQDVVEQCRLSSAEIACIVISSYVLAPENRFHESIHPALGSLNEGQTERVRLGFAISYL
jgi:hypothetical protein